MSRAKRRRERRDPHARYDRNVQKFSQLPEWLRNKIGAQCATWEAGKARTCMHAPRPDGRMPVALCAWKPDLVTCPGCTHLAVVAPGSEEARRCDRCGKVTAGTPDDRTYDAIVHLPGLTYGFAVCVACRVHRTT